MLVVLLSLREAVMSFLLVRKWKFWIWFKYKKKLYVEICRLYGKNKSSIHSVMKNKEKFVLIFLLHRKTARVTVIVRDKVLRNVEKALNFWVEKQDFYCLHCALMEKHDFYYSVIPWNCTWYCTVQVLYFSLLYRLLRIRLRCQNPLLSHIQHRKYTVNVQCSVQYTLLLHYLMLVMSYCA